MAETLFDHSHGMNYHLNSTDIAYPKVTRQHRAMKTTQDKSRRKLSKLELLQEDYRSRLLHQKEQQLNALFEQKVKANLLPKQGSVREFFLNRRMLETKPGSNTAVTLPPLKSNFRYKGAARPNKKSHVDERRLVNDTEFKNVNQKSPKEYDLNQSDKTVENEDRSSSELVQLRKLRRRKSRQQLPKRETSSDEARFAVMQSHETDLSSNAAAKYDRGRISRIGQGGEEYRIRRESRSSQARSSKTQSHKQDSRSDFASTYDRGRASRIDQKSRSRRSKIDEAHLVVQSQEQNSSSDFASSYNRGKINRIDRKEGARYPKSQSNQIYKRTAKPSPGEETSNNYRTAYGQMNQSSCNEQDLSKSLAKIKELSRRKTEEFLLRSMTAKAMAKNQSPQPSHRKNSLDEMREMEIRLRETISRERKKLLVLQQRKKEAMGETVKDISKNVSTRNEKHLGLNTPKFSQSKHNDVDGVRKRTSPPEGQSTKQAPWSTSTRHDGQQQRKELRSEKVNDLNSVSTTDLLTCSNCGRSFMRERISKHENACRKASARKKKPFDARRKRAEGTEMEKYFITGIEASDAPACEKKKANWRVKHENFIQTIRYAKGLDDKAPPPLTNPDYIECSYCRRKFKPSVAERHIPRCKDIKARPRPPRR